MGLENEGVRVEPKTKEEPNTGDGIWGKLEHYADKGAALFDEVLDYGKEALFSGAKKLTELVKENPPGDLEHLPKIEFFKAGDGLKDLNSPISSAAADKVERNMTPEQKEQLAKERTEYAKEIQKWAVMTGIGLKPPEPGPMMKWHDEQVAKTIADARSRVDRSMNGEDMRKLTEEQQDYKDRLFRRQIQIGIGIPWPEPGPRMKKYEQDVVREIRQS